MASDNGNGNGHKPCFLTGTRIAVSATATVEIETLRAGDIVVTQDGRKVPVLWVGRCSVSRRFADPLHSFPIRVKAGALGDNLPERDLLLSPCHGVAVDGLLVQAGALVNGTSIVRETDVEETFVYHNLETAEHELILVEGVPAETFFYNTSRNGFDNWAEHEALFPGGLDMAEMDLPRVSAARQVPMATKRRLLALAGAQPGTMNVAA